MNPVQEVGDAFDALDSTKPGAPAFVTDIVGKAATSAFSPQKSLARAPAAALVRAGLELVRRSRAKTARVPALTAV